MAECIAVKGKKFYSGEKETLTNPTNLSIKSDSELKAGN